MAVLSRKALLVLFFHIMAATGGVQGVMAAVVPQVTPTHAANTTSVSDYGAPAPEAPVPTEAPLFNGDAITAPAVTIPIPVISIQTWSIKPALKLTFGFEHGHEISTVYKEDSSIGGKKVHKVPAQNQGSWPAGMPRVSTPGEGSKGPSVHVGEGPDANGYTPPVYKGPVHGTEFTNHFTEADPEALSSFVSTEPQAPSRWKTWKDLLGAKESQTASTGEIGESAKFHPPATQLDRSEDEDVTSAFGGPEEGRFDPKSINRVPPPSMGGSSGHGHTGTSTVTSKDGYKISEGDTSVETKSHGDSETASYSGLGVAEYNKLKKILDHFRHGKKPLTLASAMEVAAANTSDNAVPSVREIPFNDLNKTKVKLIPRGAIKHMMDVAVVKENKTTTPLEIVKQMMETPAGKHRGLKKILDVLYDQLNKTSSNTTSRDILKHIMEVPVADTRPGDSDKGVAKKVMEVPVQKEAQPTTLQTVTRPRTVEHSANDASTSTVTSAPEFYPIEDYYHRYMKRDDSEPGVTFTLHAHVASRVWSTSSATATQDVSSHKQSFPDDPEGERYRESSDEAKKLNDAMEDSPVFDDPNAADDTNEDVHDELKDMQDEAREMSQEMDDEFRDQFGRH